MIIRLIKIVTWTIAGLLFLVLAALVGIRTEAFKSWLRDRVEEQVNAAITGELRIGRIEGNFLSHLAVRDVLVTLDADTVAYLDGLGVWVDPMPLLAGDVLVDSIVIDRPYLRLVQGDDSLWNVSRLVPPVEEEPSVSPEPAGRPPGIEAVLERLVLREGRVTLLPLDTAATIPRYIDGIALHADGYYRPDEQRVRVQRFALTTRRPRLRLTRLAAVVTRGDSLIRIEDVVVATARNGLTASGRIAAVTRGEVAVKPVELEEFRVFVGDLTMPAHPAIKAEMRLWTDSLTCRIRVEEGKQRVELDGYLSGFADTSAASDLRYGLNGTLERLDLARWTGDTTLASAIDGTVAVWGRGTDPVSMDTRFEVNLRPGNLLGRRLDRVDLRGRLAGNRFDIDGRIEADAGAADFDGRVGDPTGEPRLELLARLRDLDLAVLTGDTALASAINMTVDVRLAGTELADLRGEAGLRMRRSTIADMTIDTLWARVNTSSDAIRLDSLRLDSAPLAVHAGGAVGRDSSLALNLRLEPRDLTALEPLTGMDSLEASGAVELSVAGTIAEPRLTAILALEDLRVLTNTLARLNGTAEVAIGATGVRGNADIAANGLVAGGLAVERIAVSGDFAPDSVHGELTAVLPDSSRVGTAVAVAMRDSLVDVRIPRLALTVKGQHWTTTSDSARVRLIADTVSVSGLALRSEGQRIRVDGRLVADGPLSGNLRIEDLDVAPLAALMPDLPDLAGRANVRMTVEGTVDAPRVEGRLTVIDPVVSDYILDSLVVTTNLDDLTLSGTLNLVQDGGKALEGRWLLPVDLTPADSGSVLVADRPAEVDLTSRGYNLAMMAEFSPLLSDVKGALQLDARLRGTLAEPDLAGSAVVREAAFKVPAYGVDYRKVALNLKLRGERAVLETLEAHRDNGFVRASGTLAFDSSLVTGRIASSDVQLVGKDFLVARSSDLELRIDADTWLRGSAADPTFGGGVTIRRSRIFLPAFVSEMEGPAQMERLPLLVEARRENGPISSASRAPLTRTEDDSVALLSDYFNRLEGTLKLTIPRNTWIKSPEMNMELAGELDAVKNGPDLELFGDIRIVRGNYTLLGKRFVVREGTFAFSGGRELEPDINLVAEHVFRAADRSKNEMVLTVTGPAFQPELAFTLNDAAISEGDALSYLVFGRSLDALSGGQRSQVAGESGNSESDLARNLAAGLIAGQLQKQLGQHLNLDVIEIRGDDNWQNTTFVVGKYVTNDLFLSYKREFGDVQSDRSSLEVVTMEYELTRFLYLQLIQGNDVTSGADVIFKFER